MGFREGACATVWKVEPVSDKCTKLQISVSRKDSTSGTYETEFSGFITCLGTAVAKNAARLKPKDRIKLGNVDVTTTYSKDTNKSYTNFKLFNFTNWDDKESNGKPTAKSNETEESADVEDSRLPF